MFKVAEGIHTDFEGFEAVDPEFGWIDPQWNPIEGKWEL